MSSNEWREVSLSDVCDIIGGGTPKTSVPEYWNGEIPWLSVVDFNDEYRHVFVAEKKITELGLNNSSTKLLKPGDIVISARGTVGALAQLAYTMAFNQSCYGIRAKNDSINDFLYYAIKNILRVIKANTHGSVFETITKETFKALNIFLPPINEQKTIAATLSCLDDKIELNNRINKTLEEMAQAIFKSWFVDFEPFQNGEFIDSELGKIPKGWRVGTLDEIIELFDSKRIPLSSRKREKMQKVYPYYGATSLMDYVDDYIFDGVYVLLGEDGTVIDGKGYPILQYVWGKFWVNNHAHVLKGKNGFSEESLYILLKNTNVKSIVTGAVQLKINQSNLKSVKVIIPSVDKIAEFNYLIARFFAEKRRLSEENQILISVRDALLPKLMSGEVRVPIEEVL